MKSKIFISIALIAVLVGSMPLTTTAFAQNPNAGPGPSPLSVPGVPMTGPLSPEAIKALPKPSMDIPSINNQFDTDLAKARLGKMPGIKAPSASTVKAGEALTKSLTDQQRTALAAVFSKYEKTLQKLGTPAPGAKLSLEGAQKLTAGMEKAVTALSADVAKVLTPKQMQWYKAAGMMSVPSTDASKLNISLSSCTNCYSAYVYGSYAATYAYYGYLYAYYGYATGGHSYSYDYYAYIYAYYAYSYLTTANSYQYYTYAYKDFLNAAYAYYYAYLGNLYASYAYTYAYYSYVYFTDTYGYYYYSYIYNYYSYYYSSYGRYYSYYSLLEFGY